MIDLHNHLLRYVVPIHRTEPDLEVAVRMAQIAAADGIRIIASTPHFRPYSLGDRLPEVFELMHTGVTEINRVLRERGIEVEIVPGAEVQLDESLPELADRGLLPTLGEGRHVLIELSLTTYASFAEQVLFDLQLKGFRPVIAHFERLARAAVRDIRPEALVERGVKLQVNCESLAGKRGRIIAGAARRLLRQGLVSGLGTDAHDPDDSPPLMSPVRRAVERAAGRGSFDRLTWEEPLHIIGRGMAGAQASALP